MASPRSLGGGAAAEFPEAERLHGSIGPDRWCVNRVDLQELKAKVRSAIDHDRIEPTSLDTFCPADRKTGPSIYTVTEQYIKPMTREAGGMSWALMLHPEGLPCDVFITHAWQEGIFEFLDMVLFSLPWRARTAWCCFLANPQHLDIAGMLRTPSESPFAKALWAAPCLLVVPNGQSSVYTRLWCAYEAYLAHEWDKVIQTARPPLRAKALLHDMLLVAVSTTIGGLLVGPITLLLWRSLDDTPYEKHCFWVYYVLPVLQYFFMFASTFSRRARMRQVLNLVGILFCGTQASIAIYAKSIDGYRLLGLSGRNARDLPGWANAEVCYSIVLLLFFLVAEVDRRRYIDSRCAARLLENGYTGSIQHARCSSDEDERNIREEIGNNSEAVDCTINVLMDAGMSTPSLRSAHERGADMADAGFIEYAFVVFMFNLSVDGLWRMKSDGRTSVDEAIILADMVLSGAFLTYFASMTPDVRAFAFRVLHKCGSSLAIVPVMITLFMFHGERIDHSKMHNSLHLILLAIYTVVIPVSAAQIHRVARIPHCGPQLANLLAMRGVHLCHIKWWIFGDRSAVMRERSHEVACRPSLVPSRGEVESESSSQSSDVDSSLE